MPEDPPDAVSLEGRAVFVNGRLRSAHMLQVFDGGGARNTLRWSWELID